MPRYRQCLVGDIKDQATGRKKPAEVNRTVDPAGQEVLEARAQDGMSTVFDRYVGQQPQCGFGLTGICCRMCVQGPCRIMPKKEGAQKGICGAHDYTIVARNLIRYIAGGAASHSDHARHTARTLLAVAEGHAPDYRVKDPEKLARVAARLGIPTEGKDQAALAREVAEKAIADFTRFDDKEPCAFLTTTIVEGRRQKFAHCDIAPSSIDRAIAEVMAQSTMGMDADPVNIVFGGLKCALADYTGMHIATDLSDILLGTPQPVVSEANLGVIDPQCVNIATHGHNPILSEMVVEAARALEGEAQAAGAKAVKVMGICCTGNELLMRQGVPLAANQAAQELAVMTGAIDAVIMDVQCFIPSLRPLAECFHTRLITTDPRAKIPGSYHIEFDERRALDLAKEMVRLAIEAYRERDGNRVVIPPHKSLVVAGFSLEALLKLFASVSPDKPIRALNDAIAEGRLKGVCLFAGCNNLRVPQDSSHLAVARELAKNDVFLLATGCSAGAFAKAGWLSPQAVDELAGPGLKGFLKELEKASGVKPGLPLIFHMGSCVDNTRASDLCMAMAEDMGLDVPRVPFVASAPENMHEKAISIGSWAVAMGLPVHVGAMPPLEGSALVYGIGTQIAHDVYGGHFLLEEDPAEGARKLLDALEYRTWKLKVHRAASQKYGTALAAGW